MKRWMCGLWALLLMSSLQAGVVPVREVSLTVFEKKVTGYRLSLAMDEEALSAGIQQYLAAYLVTPVVVQEGLIYENFAYPPITSARPITLYYMVDGQDAVMSELTLVGLYTYQEDITVQRFPDLALRMLLDLSEMVQGLTGDLVDFDALFARGSVEEIRKRYQDRKERNEMDFFVQREGDWIGSEDATLIRENPFGDNRPENFATDDQVVEAITGRIKRYTAQNRSAASPFMAEEQQQQFFVLRDSLRELQRQLLQLQQQSDSLMALEGAPIVHDTLRLLTNVPDSSVIASLKTQIEGQLLTLDRLELKLATAREREDSLRRELNHKKVDSMIVSLSEPSTAKQNVRLDQLSQRNEALEAENQRLQNLSTEYKKLEQQYQQLRERFELRGRVMDDAGKRADLMENRTLNLTQENLRLLAQRDSLAQELMMLDPESESARLRREVYRRQLQTLQENQQDQTRREQELARREKQIEQRERYLAEFEASGESQALLSRIIQLENQLKTEERENERLRTEARQIRQDFQLETFRTVEDEAGYRFRPGVSDAFAREQILAWFRMRSIYPSLREPLRFEEAILPRLSDKLLTITLVSLDNGYWSLTFTTGRDTSTQAVEAPIEEVERLLGEIFR